MDTQKYHESLHRNNISKNKGILNKSWPNFGPLAKLFFWVDSQQKHLSWKAKTSKFSEFSVESFGLKIGDI